MHHGDVKRFYAEHGEELQRYLTRRLNCAQTAADLTQEVFLRLMRSESAGSVNNPRAYLYRIASNLLADHFRGVTQQPRLVGPSLWEMVPDETPSPERTLLSRDEVRRLERAIDRLPPRQREILLLHKFEGLSYRVIAERLGISENTVMVHMMRALARCRDDISED